MISSRILFVDDNFMFSWGAREFLEEWGFKVESVYCGTVAFEAIDRHQPLSGLATDIDLGPGPNGFDVARHARASYPHLPVVYMSGLAQPDYATQGVAESEFLAKPFDPRQIADALTRMIRLEAA
jgi:DNA-binding NtrC family response regulator